MTTTEIVTLLRAMEGQERSQRVRFARKQLLEGGGLPKDSLHIVYVMTHVGVCGGVKVIFEHANGLKRLGAQVTVVSHFSKPDWFPLTADYVCVPFEFELAGGIPPCDVIVATYWDHIHACTERGIAPVVYFEQGDFHLYDWEQDNVPAEVHTTVRKQYELPPYIFCVSKTIAAIIGKKFTREAAVFPNALNDAIFYPKKTAAAAKKYMLIVGSEQARFKGVADLKKVHSLVLQRGYDLELLWITQAAPAAPAGEVIVNPPQERIGELYRQAFVYVSGSYYEAFPLPPLEAMACGTPVVTTANVGAKEYCRDNVNCLMTEPGDVTGLADRIVELLTDEEKYSRLQQAGYQTAAAYKWDAILTDLYAYYKKIAGFTPAVKSNAADWVKSYVASDFVNPLDKQLLDTLLAHTDAAKVLVPVSHNSAGLTTVSWELAARRKKFSGDGYALKVNWPLKEGKMADSRPWARIDRLYRQGNYEQAYEEAQKKLAGLTDKPVQAVYMRWVILCLLKLGLEDHALQGTETALAAHPLYTDLRYIAAGLLRRRGRAKKARELAAQCLLFQDAAYYPEYFPAIAALASDREATAKATMGLKILLVSWECYPHHGGVNTYLTTLITGLRQKGHGVDLLSASDLDRLPKEALERVAQFRLRLSTEYGSKIPQEIIDTEVKRFAFKQLLALFDGADFDLVHSQNGILNPLIKERYPDIPLVGTVHGCLYSECFYWGNFTRQEADLFRDYDRSAVNIPAKVVTVSSFLDPELPPIPAGRHIVIHNGVDVDAFTPRKKSHAAIKLVTSGVFTSIKGYDILFSALIMLKGEGLTYELTMFGDGYELPKLQELAALHKLPVAFKGRIAREALIKQLPGFDVLIQPSRKENFPFAVLEAMAAGCAVICSSVSGMTEQVKPGVNGLLFAAENAEELAACLRNVMTHPAETAAMGKQARVSAEKDFSISTMVEKYEKLYWQLIQPQEKNCEAKDVQLETPHTVSAEGGKA